jgi:outer membrane protein OmpA-like peptidoglycan-associated protein
MKAFLATTCIVTSALLACGCATKKYVRNTAAPIQAKVDQVGEQTTQNTNQLQETRTQLKDTDERAQSGISAANEKADSAGKSAADAMNHANGAMDAANTAGQKADQNAKDLGSLRQVVANLDDYTLKNSVTVPFGFNKTLLTTDSKKELDGLAQDVSSDKRFFIAVEGYTDKTGDKAYNEVLSRKRADAVVEYLVAKHDIPIYRIHMIGLGKEKPVDESPGRAARAKNRRVEVKVYCADQAVAGLSEGAANRSEPIVHQ